jgi:hypothetical protein
MDMTEEDSSNALPMLSENSMQFIAIDEKHRPIDPITIQGQRWIMDKYGGRLGCARQDRRERLDLRLT